MDYSVSWKIDEIANTGISNHLVGSVSMDHWDITYRLFDGNLIPPYNTRRMNPSAPDWTVYPDRMYTYPTRYIYYNTEWLGGAVIEDVVGLFENKLLLSAALRFNYDNRSSYTAWRTPQNQDPGGTYVGNPIPTNINEKFTRRFGAVYKATDKISIYAGSTEAFLAVGAIFKVDGSRLEPETGENQEIGVKLDFLEALGGNFSFTGAYFDIMVENKWRGDPVNTGFFIQDGLQENNGWDGQIGYTSVNKKLTALAGFFKADGPTQAFTGIRAAFVPKETINFWLRYNITDAFAVGGGWKRIGDTLDGTALITAPAYNSGDVFAEYRQRLSGKRQIVYRVGVTNVADSLNMYFLSNATSAHLEDGRRTKVTVTYLW